MTCSIEILAGAAVLAASLSPETIAEFARQVQDIVPA